VATFKYPRGASPTVDAAIDKWGNKLGVDAVNKLLDSHGVHGADRVQFMDDLGKGAKWSTHKVFNILGYEAGIVGMPRSSWNKAMDAASEVYETSAIKKARVKPLRRSI
jgi:hypothetical protein